MCLGSRREGGGGVGEGQTKRQIVGSLDMSSCLHQTKETHRDLLAQPAAQEPHVRAHIHYSGIRVSDLCCLSGADLGRNTNTGLGGVTPCTQSACRSPPRRRLRFSHFTRLYCFSSTRAPLSNHGPAAGLWFYLWRPRQRYGIVLFV